MIKTGGVYRQPIRQRREAYISEQLVQKVGAGLTGHGVFQGEFQDEFQGVNVAAANKWGAWYANS
jgi:hypothetical protein